MSIKTTQYLKIISGKVDLTVPVTICHRMRKIDRDMAKQLKIDEFSGLIVTQENIYNKAGIVFQEITDEQMDNVIYALYNVPHFTSMVAKMNIFDLIYYHTLMSLVSEDAVTQIQNAIRTIIRKFNEIYNESILSVVKNPIIEPIGTGNVSKSYRALTDRQEGDHLEVILRKAENVNMEKFRTQRCIKNFDLPAAEYCINKVNIDKREIYCLLDPNMLHGMIEHVEKESDSRPEIYYKMMLIHVVSNV